jgi:VanZ family protein
MKTSSNSTLKTYITAYSLPIIWAIFIFSLSTQQVLPSFEFSTLDYVFKKCSHIFVYGVLYYLLSRAANKTIPQPSVNTIWLPVFLTLAYAASDEIHQFFVPGRYGTIRDIGYDLLGAGIVFLRQYRYI